MATFDIVIHGGRVIDGTGNPWFYGDVAIKDGKIASIGKIAPKPARGRSRPRVMWLPRAIIDMHTHSDQPIIADGNAESKVRQGVTLDIIGESQTVAPLEGAILEEYRPEHRKRQRHRDRLANVHRLFRQGDERRHLAQRRLRRFAAAGEASRLRLRRASRQRRRAGKNESSRRPGDGRRRAWVSPRRGTPRGRKSRRSRRDGESGAALWRLLRCACRQRRLRHDGRTGEDAAHRQRVEHSRPCLSS